MEGSISSPGRDTISISADTGFQALSDAKRISMISADQCRAARILLGWSADQLASSANLGIASVKRFESGQAVQGDTREAIAAALVSGGVVFLADGERSAAGGEGVRLAPRRSAAEQ